MSYLWVESGSILDSPARMLVCPVNCRAGVMGAGLARSFAARWPELVGLHRKACLAAGLRPGYLAAVPVREDDIEARRMILFFPTKDDWREPARLEWIREGIACMGRILDMLPKPPEVMRVAVPALGCGLGGLPWAEVKPLIVALARDHDDVQWHLYPPR